MTVVEREVVVPVVTERERRASILEAAALEIEVRGWTTGTVHDCHSGAVCLVGGIYAAANGSPDDENSDDGYILAAQVWGLGDTVDDSHPLFRFNDGRDDETGLRRTASDVTFLLRWRAAEIRDGL